jgi:hypothetical protein
MANMSVGAIQTDCPFDFQRSSSLSAPNAASSNSSSQPHPSSAYGSPARPARAYASHSLSLAGSEAAPLESAALLSLSLDHFTNHVNHSQCIVDIHMTTIRNESRLPEP